MQPPAASVLSLVLDNQELERTFNALVRRVLGRKV